MPLYQLQIASTLIITALGSSVVFYLNRPTEGKIQLPLHSDSNGTDDAFDVTKPEDIIDGYPIDGEGFWAQVRNFTGQTSVKRALCFESGLEANFGLHAFLSGICPLRIQRNWFRRVVVCPQYQLYYG